MRVDNLTTGGFTPQKGCGIVAARPELASANPGFVKGPKVAISLRRTSAIADQGVKILVYGQAGAGKTSLIPTLPNPVVLSAEGGLLSIKDADLPFIEIGSIGDLTDAYRWLTESSEASQFESVALDSISEIAEVVLSAEKKANKDPRAAYGAMQDRMAEVIRHYRDLPGKHVYFSAKLDKTQDEMGRILYSPGMPGNKTGQSLPYFFDEVLALRIERSEENSYRVLMTNGDGQWTAKDRSGRLEQWEAPDLGEIINKIRGVQP